MLYAQFARHGEMDWSRSEAAYDSIVTLTRIYNTGYFNNSKWSRIMDHQPRRLPVFEPRKTFLRSGAYFGRMFPFIPLECYGC